MYDPNAPISVFFIVELDLKDKIINQNHEDIDMLKKTDRKEYTRKALSKLVTILKQLSPSASSHTRTTSVHVDKSHTEKLQAKKFRTTKKSHIVRTSHVHKSVHTDKFVQVGKTFESVKLSQVVKTSSHHVKTQAPASYKAKQSKKRK
ncbi:unnamed protein product [Lactuca saligna]|uniref:Uncharacterized protein n=1 Tax=Lactuca saligna TaxID=75948 RepID=A0AA36E7R5_LACSI|nr:unnamed protein product [Lactuca saligna]